MKVQCSDCVSKEVCAYKGQMEALAAELADKMKLMENQVFRAEVKCIHHVLKPSIYER